MSSLRQLARTLNLSHSTISAALRDLPGVKPDTRARVLQEAEKRGYRANPLASALMGEMRRARAGVFRGVVTVVRLKAGGASDPAGKRRAEEIAQAARERAAELGFLANDLEIDSRGAAFSRLAEIVDARGSSGVLVLPCADTDALRRMGAEMPVMVYADAPDDDMLLDAVCPDYHQALSLMVKKLAEAGVKKPALWLDRDLPPPARARLLAAYRSFFSEREAPLPPAGMHGAPERFAAWARAENFDALLSTDPAAEAFAAPAGFMVGGLYPRSGGEAAAGAEPHLSRVGRRAMEVLCEKVMRRERGGSEAGVRILVPASWREAAVGMENATAA